VLELTLDAPPALEAEATAVIVVVALVAIAPAVVLAPAVVMALMVVDELTLLVATCTEPVLVVVGSDTVVAVPVATWDTVLGAWSTGPSEEHAQVLAPQTNAAWK
jgi:hypothetical protein